MRGRRSALHRCRRWMPSGSACIGHSLGGHNTMFTPAFDHAHQGGVSSCGFCSFPTYMKGNLTAGAHDGYMPRIAHRLRSEAGEDAVRFPRGGGRPRPAAVPGHRADAGRQLRRARRQGLHRPRRGRSTSCSAWRRSWRSLSRRGTTDFPDDSARRRTSGWIAASEDSELAACFSFPGSAWERTSRGSASRDSPSR